MCFLGFQYVVESGGARCEKLELEVLMRDLLPTEGIFNCDSTDLLSGHA